MTIQINGSLVTGTYTNSRRFWEIISKRQLLYGSATRCPFSFAASRFAFERDAPPSRPALAWVFSTIAWVPSAADETEFVTERRYVLAG